MMKRNQLPRASSRGLLQRREIRTVQLRLPLLVLCRRMLPLCWLPATAWLLHGLWSLIEIVDWEPLLVGHHVHPGCANASVWCKIPTPFAGSLKSTQCQTRGRVVHGVRSDAWSSIFPIGERNDQGKVGTSQGSFVQGILVVGLVEDHCGWHRSLQ